MVPTDPYPEYLKTHRDVRVHHTSYYEKLALLDGGIVALAVNAVLGDSHSLLKHKKSPQYANTPSLPKLPDLAQFWCSHFSRGACVRGQVSALSRGVVPFCRPYPLSHTRVDTAGSVVNTLRT